MVNIFVTCELILALQKPNAAHTFYIGYWLFVTTESCQRMFIERNHVISFTLVMDNSVHALDNFWPSNGTENLLTHGSDHVIFKYVHAFGCKLNDDEMWFVVNMVIILKCLEFENVSSRKFQIKCCISSQFDLYLNSCTYFEIATFNLLYTELSVMLNSPNVFINKKARGHDAWHDLCQLMNLITFLASNWHHVLQLSTCIK